MIQIKIDQTLDVQTYQGFSSLIIGGVNFGEKIRSKHPDISSLNYHEYIQKYYQENEKQLLACSKELQNEVDGKAHDFFLAIESIFKIDFSLVEYSGVISIFDCNPRFVEEHLFQVYFDRDLIGKVGVVYHEVLHFIFFDYCKKYCADLIDGRDENRGAYWELSEIFNVIILNQIDFQKILGRPEKMFYPELVAILLEVEQIWTETAGNLRDFIEQSLRLLDAK